MTDSSAERAPINSLHSGGAPAGSKVKIDRLISLPFSKSLEISFKNLKVRFFRSLITTASLTLAVSFLSFILVNLDVAAGLMSEGTKETARMLSHAGFDVDFASRTVTMSAKERWIVFLSLLVCAVGIINAQLMAVTERFREIGIMKCLGALDSMILKLFLLEAGMQGFVGAAAGAAVGCLISLLVNLVRFGFGSWSSLSLFGVLLSMGIATGVGLVLSLIGVAYPAYTAARMRPVLALKAEH